MNERKRRGDEAVAEILLEQLAIIRANVAGSIAGENPDPLHDLRVALRRTRTLLKGYPGVFTPVDLERFKREFKELQTITGPARDYDVLIADLDDFAEERPQLATETAVLRKELVSKRHAAGNKLKRRLVSKRFEDLLQSWETLLKQLPESAREDRPDAKKPIGKLSRKRIKADRKRFSELGKRALKTGDLNDLHHARKRGKSLRYNVEFFGHLNPKKKSERLRKKLKKVQDELGDFQDTVVQEAALRDAVESSASVPAAVAAGAMIERALAERKRRFKRFRFRFVKLGGK
jgi:CHAD domain-containing protein